MFLVFVVGKLMPVFFVDHASVKSFSYKTNFPLELYYLN